MPATPPPTTIAAGLTFIVRFWSGSRSLAFATAILTRSFAFLVAAFGSCMCIHEHWSLMFAISNRY